MPELIQQPLSSKVYDVEDSAAAQELYHSNGWTDGLPVVPPTEASVRACLDGPGCARPAARHRAGADAAHNGREPLNSVMAGCLPMHFPVVATAWQAMMKDEFLLHGTPRARAVALSSSL
jgi:hypothetical protein